MSFARNALKSCKIKNKVVTHIPARSMLGHYDRRHTESLMAKVDPVKAAISRPYLVLGARLSFSLTTCCSIRMASEAKRLFANHPPAAKH